MELRFSSILFVLLVGSLVIASSPALLGSSTTYQSISNFGTTRSSYTDEYAWAKTVTWADSTQDDIKVDDKGKIYVNNQETTAFGFVITWSPYYMNKQTGHWLTDAEANTALDWLQEKGVRFVHLWVGCQGVVSGGDNSREAYLDFWLPKTYAHKMFVVLGVAQYPHTNPTTTTQYSKFCDTIDLIDNQTLANTIFAVSPCVHELAGAFETASELEDYVSYMIPNCRTYTASSLIGNVPMITKPTCGSLWNIKGEVCLEYSDVPSVDLYPKMDDPLTAAGIIANCESGFNKMHEVMAKYGFSGYGTWFLECGQANLAQEARHDAPPTDYFPEVLEHQLSGGAYGDCSALFLWVLQYYETVDAKYRWGAFYLDGTAKPWIENLAPYFPKVGG